MAQAKQAEPKGWKLLSQNGEKFAEGNIVSIDNQEKQIGGLGRWMKNKKAVYWIMGAFGAIYILLFISYGPWWLCI